MSKKLAEDLTGLVLDVKTGSGAFITDPKQSLELAKTMIGIGEARGVRTTALLTAMDRPLGHACGNALETAEAIRGLHGEGPADLMEVTYALGVEMLLVGGKTSDRPAARRLLEATIASGRAARKLEQLIEAQGGDPAVVADPSRLPAAPVIREIRSPSGGLLVQVEPRAIGHAIIQLGGGRSKSDDIVDPAVGIVIPVKPGQRLSPGQLLATVHAHDTESAALAADVVRKAMRLGERANPLPLVSHRVTAEGVVTL
jgi:pyrimidine-nucleoside phosphorylase